MFPRRLLRGLKSASPVGSRGSTRRGQSWRRPLGRSQPTRSLALEPLEDRTLLAVLNVTTFDDVVDDTDGL
ncbi:MAG: hypothetical protein ACYTG0_44435, partial [Planctomycetota bacterium]